MSPWLFSLFMDVAMKEVREKAGDVIVTLRDERRNIDWRVDRLTLKRQEFRMRNKTTYTGNGGSSLYGTMPKR